MQLLKLGCAHLIKTPFYLITDADTFYLNPFSAGKLLLLTSEVSADHRADHRAHAQAVMSCSRRQPHLDVSPVDMSFQLVSLKLLALHAEDLFHVSACNSTEQHIVCNAQRSEAYRCTPQFCHNPIVFPPRQLHTLQSSCHSDAATTCQSVFARFKFVCFE